MRAVDVEILNFMLTEKVVEKDYSKQFETCEGYTVKLITIKQKENAFFKPTEKHRSQNFIDVDRMLSQLLRPLEIILQLFDGDASL